MCAMHINERYEKSAIDLLGEPLLVSTVEQFLGLWKLIKAAN